MFEDKERMKELLHELGLEERVEKDNPRRKKILIVEEVNCNMDAAGKYFEKENIGVEFVCLNTEAVDIIKQSHKEYLGVIFDGDETEHDDCSIYDAVRMAEEKAVPYIVFKEYQHSDGTWLSEVYIDELELKIKELELKIKEERDSTPGFHPGKEKEEGWEEAFKILKEVVKNPDYWRKVYDKMKWDIENFDEIMAEKEERMKHYRGDNNV